MTSQSGIKSRRRRKIRKRTRKKRGGKRAPWKCTPPSLNGKSALHCVVNSDFFANLLKKCPKALQPCWAPNEKGNGEKAKKRLHAAIDVFTNDEADIIWKMAMAIVNEPKYKNLTIGDLVYGLPWEAIKRGGARRHHKGGEHHRHRQSHRDPLYRHRARQAIEASTEGMKKLRAIYGPEWGKIDSERVSKQKLEATVGIALIGAVAATTAAIEAGLITQAAVTAPLGIAAWGLGIGFTALCGGLILAAGGYYVYDTWIETDDSKEEKKRKAAKAKLRAAQKRAAKRGVRVRKEELVNRLIEEQLVMWDQEAEAETPGEWEEQ